MKNRRLLFLNAACVFLIMVCLVLGLRVSGCLYNVQTAQRWKGESPLRFSHVACYFPPAEGKNREVVRTLRTTVEQRLSEAGIEASENGRLYTDSYSAFGSVTAVGEHGSAELSAVGVGGEFFVFHPLHLLSGGYIAEQDLMKDRVILDEVAAWQLFGGCDVAGLTITINGSRYYVAGVVEKEEDYASRRTDDEKPLIYLSYDALSALSDVSITAYEIVMPEPVRNFASSILREHFAPENTAELVHQSERYAFSGLWKTFWNIGNKIMGGGGIVYPQWEQAIRLTEFHLSLLLIAMLVFAAFPVVTGLVILIKLVCRVLRFAKRRIPEILEQRIEEKKEKKYQQMTEDRQWQESP